MFDFISGILAEASPLKAVIENQGLGYRLLIPVKLFSKLPQIGKPTRLFVSTVIREDSHTLYGFLEKSERDLFETLIGITGIGPKTALSLIGHLEIASLQSAIAQSNSALLSKIPGIGKKTSERLIIELRDKLSKLPTSSLQSDALSALLNLGYNASVAQKALAAALAEAPAAKLPQLITLALRSL